jgi:hypothetical protein
VTPSGGRAFDLATGEQIAEFPVAYDASGYDNAIEARIPGSLLGGTRQPGVAVASSLLDDAGLFTRTANVAFRFDEPAQEWWDKRQALALHAGSIDEFFLAVDLDRMDDGATERYVPGPGYHEAIFTSTENISEESGDKGLLQRYGVYLPTSYTPGRDTPAQFWLHFRGGTAHVAAHVVPGVFWDMGEDHDTMVITPHGRGTSGWYVGKSGIDIEQVWADSHERFSIDENRTYVAGHSMGGFGSWLLPIMHPDRFAGAFPASPPVTQGAWTGLDLGEQCDEYQFEEYSPCFIQANGGDARAQWLTPLVDNLREVPYAIYHGAQDELVPASGVTLHTKRFQDLGYRYRYYLFQGQEHYGPPAVDQWAEGADYLHTFVRNPNPARVTYVRSMPFENAIERVNAPEGAAIDFDLSHAYWMSGLQAADPDKGIARFDGTSLGLPRVTQTTSPEADAGGKAGNLSPFTMVGQAWQADPSAAPAENAFDITLTGAKAVTLDLERMKLSLDEPLQGAVSTDTPLALTLVEADGTRRTLQIDPGTTSLAL